MSDLFFEIDKEGSETSRTLQLKSSHPLTVAVIQKLPRGKEAAQFVFQQELSYRKVNAVKFDGNPISIFHVPYSESIAALKLLALGLLRFNGKPLACDFYGRSEMHFAVEKGLDGSISIASFVHTSSQKFLLSSCDFLCGGPTPWYIKGVALRLISTELTWKDLLLAYQTPEKLTLKLLQSYNDDDGDAQALKIVFSDEITSDLNENDKIEFAPPLPLLILSDRMGAFASLWMTYPAAIPNEFHRVPYDDPVGGGLKKIQRNLDLERQWEQDLLETDFIRKNVGQTHYYCPVDKVAKSLTFLLEVGWHIEDSKGRRVCRESDRLISVESDEKTFLVKGKIQYENYAANLTDVIGAFNRRERFVVLGSGTIGLLSANAELESIISAVEEGEIVSEGVKVNRSQFGSLASALEGNRSVVCDSSFSSLKEKLLAFKGINHCPPGSRFTAELRPYQQAGVDWIAFLYEHHFHGLLADDMGLGKTVQVLAFLSQLSSNRPILIVLPTSLLFNWKREIERFLPDMQLVIHHGPQRPAQLELNESPCIILTSYATLRLDLPIFENILFECVVLDEAQVIKNASTLTAQALYRLNGRFRLSLSGTPIENHLKEMWSHFRFLMPELFGSEQEFISEIESGALDPRHLQRIRRKIAPFFLRRRKEEVAKELPERIEQTVWIEMGSEQRRVYEDFLAGFKGNLFKKVQIDGISKHRMEVLEAILRLRQICCHPKLALSQHDDVNAASSAKFELLLDDLETVISEGAKVLVYSQFTSMLSLISKELQSRNWKFAYLDGATRNREQMVEQFQNDPNTQIFLISLKAGGIGLNLTAADYVFIFDPWWNDAAENQAIDRAHRIGRKSTVIARRYLVAESIEEKMMKLKAAKRSLIESVIDEELGQTSLSIEDLKFLLEMI